MARPFGRGSSSNNNRIRIRFQSGGSCRRISRLSIKRSNTKCKKTRKVTQQGTVPIIINSKKICKQKSKSVTRKKGERMGESQHHHSSRRLGLRAAATAASTRGSDGREIVEVQGGHIMRSIGRKDRHSKVCTAKGPRDRRVRLSAPTAIQFYDVQDRLGYDRPSKAVDWLINKAKAAIDELAYSSAWTPTTTTTTTSSSLKQGHEEEDMLHFQHKTEPAASGFGFQQQQQQMNNPSQSSSGFLPPSLDSDAISDTIKSFFPMGGGATSSSYSIHFQNYPPDLTRTSSSQAQAQAQDLRLSLHQSFPDPNLLQQQEPHHHPQPTPSVEQTLFSAWSEQQQTGTDTQYQRTVAWNAGTNTSSSSSGGDERGGGFINQFFSQRGPLQSNNSPWMDQQIPTASDHLMIGFASGGFSGFQIPARIQGEEEHDKPPSSSASRH